MSLFTRRRKDSRKQREFNRLLWAESTNDIKSKLNELKAMTKEEFDRLYLQNFSHNCFDDY